MIHFSVNGKETQLDALPDTLMEELIETVRRQYNSDTSLISSIRVNGNELLDSDDEASLTGIRVGEIDTMEIVTTHPRELAEETLQSLIPFTGHLEKLSRRASSQLASSEPATESLERLLDGIQTFTEALVSSKQLLRIGRLDPCDVLEADLTSILTDLVQFQEQGQRAFVIDLLENHLPLNLQDWGREGIPALIRSRDS